MKQSFCSTFIPTPLVVAILGLAPLGRAQLAGVWTELPGPGSPALSHHSMTYDSGNHRLIVAGQVNWTDEVVYEGLPDGTWHSLPSPTPEPDGADVEIAYDPDRGVTVLYTNDGNKVWELGAQGWELKEPATTPIQCGDGALLEYDPVRQRTVLVGCEGFPEEGTASETWLWDGTDWTLAAGRDQSPPGAAGGMMAFDAARGVMVLVTMSTMETWTWDGTAWTQQEPATVPQPGVWVSFLAYHPPSQQCVFFGGEHVEPGDPFPITSYPTTTWAWDGSDWATIQTPSTPPANIDFGWAWFPEMNALVMHGGWSDATNWQPGNAVWKLEIPTGPPAGDIRFTGIRLTPPDTLELTSTGGGGPGWTQTLQGTTDLGAADGWTDLESRANAASENTWTISLADGAPPHQAFRIVETP